MLSLSLSRSCTLVRSKLTAAQMLSCPLLSLLLLCFFSIFVKILPLKILPSSRRGFSGPPATWKDAYSPPFACLPSPSLCCNAMSLFTPGLSAPLSTSLCCHCAHQARRSPDTRRVSFPPPCNNLPSFVLDPIKGSGMCKSGRCKRPSPALQISDKCEMCAEQETGF